nr:GxGYxYP family putative glycoside hydrolase [Candidatus Sigynarchaeota archaeon]
MITLALVIATSCLLQDTDRKLPDEKGLTRVESFIRPSQPYDEHAFDIIDIRGILLNHYELVVLASIEGIVNKDDAKLFVLDSTYNTLWLDYINASPYLGYERNISNLSDIITLYASNFTGLVVFDGDSYDELNLASPLAGVHRALLVPSQIVASIPGTWDVKVNVTQDLLNCTTRRERYHYAIEHYFPLCNQSAFAIWDGRAPRNMRNFIISDDLFT